MKLYYLVWFFNTWYWTLLLSHSFSMQLYYSVWYFNT